MNRRLLLSCALGLAALAAPAAHIDESIALTKGWNAVYIESTPDVAEPAALFADAPVQKVACYESSAYADTAQYNSDGSALEQKSVGFYFWQRGEEEASTLRRMTGGGLRAFKERHYIAPRIVIAVSGSFTQANIDRIARRFSALDVQPDLTMPGGSYTPALCTKRKAIEQNQITLGFPGIPTGGDERFTMNLLSSILGGNMSSRLFQTVREKHGLCYAVYSFTAGFLDCGMFGVSTAVGRDTERRALELILEELEKFRQDGVTQSELDRAREQITASVLLAEESTASHMNKLGYSELFLGGAAPAREILQRYDAVTREDILALAQRTLDFDRMSFSAVGRIRPAEDYRALLNRS